MAARPILVPLIACACGLAFAASGCKFEAPFDRPRDASNDGAGGGAPDAPPDDDRGIARDMGPRDVGPDGGAGEAGADADFDAETGDAIDAGDLGVPEVDGGDAGLVGDTGVEPDGGTPDVGLVDAAASTFTYTPSNFMPASITTAGAPAVLNCGVTRFNSTTNAFTNWCPSSVDPPIVTDPTAGAPTLIVLGGLDLRMGATFVIEGERPVIIVAFGPVTIAGALEANAAMATAGAGGSLAACMGSTGENGTRIVDNGGGAGGGGHATAGALGGNGAANGPRGNGGGVGGTAEGVPLRGGCSGGRGGPSLIGSGGLGGGGGGAIQISAAGDLSISGRVTANGGGGLGGNGRDGGGGGGSGGMILLEGLSVQLATTAILAANGGSGGEGGSSGGLNGGPGRNGNASAAPAIGGAGSMSAGNGGNGAAGMASPMGGQTGQMGSGGGGGGGGAMGFIRVNSASPCVVNGTPVMSPDPSNNGAANCP